MMLPAGKTKNIFFPSPNNGTPRPQWPVIVNQNFSASALVPSGSGAHASPCEPLLAGLDAPVHGCGLSLRMEVTDGADTAEKIVKTPTRLLVGTYCVVSDQPEPRDPKIDAFCCPSHGRPRGGRYPS